MTAGYDGIILRRRPVPSYVFGVIALVLFGVLLFGKLPPAPLQSFAIVTGLFALLSIITLLVFFNTYIVIYKAALIIRTPFHRRTIDWKRVAKTYIVNARKGKAIIKTWCFDMADGSKIRIPLKFYSTESLALLGKAVVINAAPAITDERIYTLAGGKVPWRPSFLSSPS